jgi:hypothetical protein
MKAEVEIEEVKKDKKYPYIGISDNNNQIVLFTSYQTGITLHNGNSDNKIGDFYDCWHEDRFKEFKGSITLSND